MHLWISKRCCQIIHGAAGDAGGFEFAILDGGTLDMVGRFEELRDAAQPDPVLAASIAGELISSEIEIRSGRGEDFADAVRRQRDHRRRLFSLALERGVALGATGTHPWADYRDQRIIDTAHYRRVEDGLKYVAWRNNTFSLHVHVGIRDADRAIAVCDRLRPVLPLLLAVSANSPFVDGRDSGLHTARTQTFTKSFPRCGVPDPFGTWGEFAEYVRMLERTNSIVEYTQVWWSVRPHVSFGTVEVRMNVAFDFNFQFRSGFESFRQRREFFVSCGVEFSRARRELLELHLLAALPADEAAEQREG